MDDVKQKACEVVLGEREHFGAFSESAVAGRIADALHAAGLLRTGVERECVEACKRVATRGWEQGSHDGGTWSAGRAALEAEKPKVRWTVRQSRANANHFIVDGPTVGQNLGGFTEPQARAVADALNALEARP